MDVGRMHENPSLAACGILPVTATVCNQINASNLASLQQDRQSVGDEANLPGIHPVTVFFNLRLKEERRTLLNAAFVRLKLLRYQAFASAFFQFRRGARVIKPFLIALAATRT